MSSSETGATSVSVRSRASASSARIALVIQRFDPSKGQW